MTDTAELIARECRKCGAQFLPTPYQVRKCAYICRACRTAQNKEWSQKRRLSGNPVKRDPEAVRFTNARRSARPEVKEVKRIAAARRLQDPAERPKIQARRKLRDAIKLGKITKGACERCGDPHVQAHHDDYSKPLDVRWLCKAHHDEHHSRERLVRDQGLHGIPEPPTKKTLAEYTIERLRELGLASIAWYDAAIAHEILSRADAPHRDMRMFLNAFERSGLFEKRLIQVGHRSVRCFEIRERANV